MSEIIDSGTESEPHSAEATSSAHPRLFKTQACAVHLTLKQLSGIVICSPVALKAVSHSAGHNN